MRGVLRAGAALWTDVGSRPPRRVRLASTRVRDVETDREGGGAPRDDVLGELRGQARAGHAAARRVARALPRARRRGASELSNSIDNSVYVSSIVYLDMPAVSNIAFSGRTPEI